MFDYFSELDSAVTICDAEGIIVYMNQKAESTFGKWGGRALIGKSLFHCHNEQSGQIIRQILASGQPNTYTIEKQGQKKLIHQAPWKHEGKIAGLIEISIVLPADMPHKIRG